MRLTYNEFDDLPPHQKEKCNIYWFFLLMIIKDEIQIYNHYYSLTFKATDSLIIFSA